MHHLTTTYIAIAIFIITLALVIIQPKGLSIGWPATIGALVAFGFGIVDIQNVITVWGIIWNATFTFVAIIIISLVLDKIGFFEWSALHMLKAAGGSAKKAFVYVLILGAAVAAVFANDGAALILTPIVYEQVRTLGFNKKEALPVIIAAGFIADTTSLPFIISNLVNIVSAGYFHIGFLSYAKTMLPVDIISFLASLGMLLIFFRKTIPSRTIHPEQLPLPKTAIKDLKVFKAGWIVLFVLLLAYFSSSKFNFPVSVPAVIAALILVILASKSPSVNVGKIIKEAPWKIVIFSLGMYIVVFGLKNVGLVGYLGHGLGMIKGQNLFSMSLISGFGAAILSAIMNNMPTVLIGSLAIASAGSHGLVQTTLVYANIVGCDLGPKFTPIGSLATLLWLHVLETKGIKITWKSYFKTGIILTVPVLGITLLGLAAWTSIIN